MNSLILLSFVIVLVMIYLLIKKRGYVEGLLALSGLGGFIGVIVGLEKVTDHINENDVGGALLMGIGIFSFLAIAIVIKILFHSK